MKSMSGLPHVRIEDLPIPDEVRVNASWPDSLAAMADHIDARAVMLIAERFGGLDIYVPVNPDKSPVRELIGDDMNAIFCRIYGREYLPIPLAKDAVFYAKCPPVIAAVKARSLSISDAAYILRTTRRRICALMRDGSPVPAAQPYRLAARVDPRQLVMFGEEEAA